MTSKADLEAANKAVTAAWEKTATPEMIAKRAEGVKRNQALYENKHYFNRNCIRKW